MLSDCALVKQDNPLVTKHALFLFKSAGLLARQTLLLSFPFFFSTCTLLEPYTSAARADTSSLALRETNEVFASISLSRLVYHYLF